MTPTTPTDPARSRPPMADGAGSGQPEHPTQLGARNTATSLPPRGDVAAPTSPQAVGPGASATREGSGAQLRPGTGATPETPAGGAPASRGKAADSVPLAGSTWTIELPAGLELLSLNGREHWAARNRTYQSLKKAAWAMTLNARLPHLERVAVTLVYDPPDRRHRDVDNLAATLKAVVDGIVASGRIGPGVPARPGMGDDSRYVSAVSMEISGQLYPRGRLRLIIREVPAADAVRGTGGRQSATRGRTRGGAGKTPPMSGYAPGMGRRTPPGAGGAA